MNIAKIAVNRPTLVVVVFTVLIFLGMASYTTLNYELMPNFSSPVFTIATVYPGASPAEVENSVTKKLEDAITSVENLDNIRSFSQEGVSIIVVTLKFSADADAAMQDAQRRISAAKSLLPIGVLDPMVTKLTISDLPVMNIGATSALPSTEFFDLLKYRIQPNLARLEGVGEISIIGGNEREIRVNLDAKKLEAYHLSALQILQAIQSSNLDFPTGKIKNSESQMVIRLSAKFKTVGDIENVIVSLGENGSKVKLKDIAEVLDTEKETTMLARVNGKNSVGLSIKRKSGANTVEVCHLINKELAKLENTYKSDNLKFEVPFDSSVFTEKAASSVMHDLMYAVILVALVMLVFLHGLRNAFIVMIAIPISLVVSFLGMYLLGYTLNIMTMVAMSLVIGILVDDAIVVLENIYRHMEMGKDRVQATLDGRSEISYTAVSITLVDVVVFLPLGLSKSIISPMIGPFALVIVITTLLSLLVAFTVVPLLTSRLARLQHLSNEMLSGRFFLWFEKQVDSFASLLHTILLKAFRHNLITLMIVSALFVGTIALIPTGFVGSEVMGMGDAGEFMIQVELPKDATLKETNLKTLEVEHLLFTKPEVKSVFTTVGSASSGMLTGGTQSNAYKAEINVKLVDKEFRDIPAQIYANRIKNELNRKITGIKVRTVFLNPFLGGTDDSPLQVIVKSSNPDSLIKYGKIIRQLIEKTPGANDITSSLEDAGNEIVVDINKEKMADLGLSLATVGPVMSTAFSGNTDTKFKDGSYEYDIDVVYDEFNRRSMKDVSNLEFINAAGQPVKLSQFANIFYGTGSSKLERYDRISCISVQGQALGRASGDVGDDIKKQIAAITFPPDVSISYDSDMKFQDDAFGSLGFALLTAIFFVYLIMVALYESYLYPFVVLFSIPLAIIGAIFALALTKTNLSIFTIMGMIMLVGLVAKNAILVVDFTNHLKKNGYRTTHALLMATRIRLRPVLMTTLSMIIGLMPIALASGAASEWKNGIGWVLIGGLTSSMFLTLIIVPIVYSLADRAKSKFQSWFARFKTS
ncbi:MAG: acriflavin resistance protein [Bacteroidetes bacterium GWF2_42_66]|nr:MAG: acriflavin resistance protein [Bacteroidetes bacterium GWE2_42_39]OFY46234.1 MAG: acriflavin resistance protein [Bacteroidetes bacterium GWF2_42_66]HAZ01691.1 acriflavin resistance protein [Marinilabiliales bacterium]HBL78397.1 acriflavin resistance protein [Prolixibacteraceae bacterium]HCU59997.1 acriflavin resistance protein [Prolixibacteraceae bacterium]